jgi:hypothetical protein
VKARILCPFSLVTVLPQKRIVENDYRYQSSSVSRCLFIMKSANETPVTNQLIAFRVVQVPFICPHQILWRSHIDMDSIDHPVNYVLSLFNLTPY